MVRVSRSLYARRVVVGRVLRKKRAPTSKLECILRLVAGYPKSKADRTDYQDLLNDLRSSLSTVFELMEQSRAADTQKSRAILPYATRSFLELALNTFIARVDPFRILALRKCQLGSDYDLGSRYNLALSWMGDVYTKNGGKNVSWVPDKQPQNISRAILDGPWAELAWVPAFERARDLLNNLSGDWMTELRALEPEKFGLTARGRLLMTYSSLSKGVHHELVIPKETLLDATTLRTVCADVVKWVCYLAYVSHFIDHSAVHMHARDALACFKVIQELEGQA